MWTIIKIKKDKRNFLKTNLKLILGNDIKIYSPKILIKRFIKNKLSKKEIDLLGDYVFIFSNNFQKNSFKSLVRYCKGVKDFLPGFQNSQKEINEFINRCKNCENENGFLSNNFFEICENQKYRFISGPFADMIFKIIKLQKNKIDILLGNMKTSLKKEEFLFSPI